MENKYVNLIGKYFQLTGIPNSKIRINKIKDILIDSKINDDGSISPPITITHVSENGYSWIQYIDRESYCKITDI